MKIPTRKLIAVLRDLTARGHSHGYRRVMDELAKIGIDVQHNTVKNALNRCVADGFLAREAKHAGSRGAVYSVTKAWVGAETWKPSEGLSAMLPGGVR